MAFYLKRIERRDTQADIDYRFACRAAADQVKTERLARFPQITPENAAEIVAWQEARMKELTHEAGEAALKADAAARRAKK